MDYSAYLTDAPNPVSPPKKRRTVNLLREPTPARFTVLNFMKKCGDTPKTPKPKPLDKATTSTDVANCVFRKLTTLAIMAILASEALLCEKKSSDKMLPAVGLLPILSICEKLERCDK